MFKLTWPQNSRGGPGGSDNLTKNLIISARCFYVNL